MQEIKSFKQLFEEVEKHPTLVKTAVADAADLSVIKASVEAYKLKLTFPIFIGEEKKIRQIGEENEIDLSPFDIVDEPDSIKAVYEAVRMVHYGEASILKKGLVPSAEFLRGILDKKIGLRKKPLLTHVMVAEITQFNRLLLLTDAAILINPDLDQKAQALQNAIDLAKLLGISLPKAAVIAAVELVNPSMQATIDAAALSKMCDRGQIKGGLVDGPLALDNAISIEAAEHKGIRSQVAGRADILVMPELVCANVFYKSLTYFANAEIAAVILGATAPAILTSRADSTQSKLNSLALAALMVQRGFIENG